MEKPVVDVEAEEVVEELPAPTETVEEVKTEEVEENETNID